MHSTTPLAGFASLAICRTFCTWKCVRGEGWELANAVRAQCAVPVPSALYLTCVNLHRSGAERLVEWLDGPGLGAAVLRRSSRPPGAVAGVSPRRCAPQRGDDTPRPHHQDLRLPHEVPGQGADRARAHLNFRTARTHLYRTVRLRCRADVFCRKFRYFVNVQRIAVWLLSS